MKSPAPAPADPARPWLKRQVWRDRALLLAPTVAFGLVILTIWIFVAWFAIERPKALREEQQRELATSVRSAAMQTESVLRQAESAMRVVDLWLFGRKSLGQLDEVGLAQLADTVRGSSGRLIEVVLVARGGSVRRLEARRGQPALSLADTDLSSAQRAITGQGITVGAPLRLGAEGDDASLRLPLLMPLSASVGEFTAVLALIDLDRLRELHRLFLEGPDAALVMLRADGLALSRAPELAGFVGRDVFAKFPERRADFGDSEGYFTTTGAASDQRARVGAYVNLADFGIRLLLSNTEDAALAEHRRTRRDLIVAAALASAALVLLGRWLGLLQRAARLRDAALQATSNAVTIGLFRTATDGRIVYVNESYLRVHGLKREEIAWGWTRLVPEEQRAPLIERWKHHMATGEPIEMVRKLKRGDDGRIRMLAVRTSPLIMDGQVVGQAGTVEDVTERGEQDKARKTLTAIFDMTPDYVGQLNEDGDIVYANPAARRRLGLAPDAPLEGLNITRFYAPERLKSFKYDILPTATRDGHWHGRSAVLVEEGNEVPVDSTVLVHRDVRGRVETISVIMRDMSEQQRAQRERQRSEAMLMAVAHTTPALISVIDTERRVIFLNEAFEAQRGVKHGQWLGRPVAELLGVAGYAQRSALFDQALRGQTSRSELAVLQGREQHSFDIQIAPLRVQSGEIDGAICIELDVTQARREEARLRLASQTDGLTQLLNRSGFEDGALALLIEAREQGHRVAVLYLDLDKFKPVNDTHGHPTGDALLKAVALRLRHALRPNDLLARLGGDEFAVLLPEIDSESDVGTVAAKLIQAIATPFHIGELQLEIGLSVGWCMAEASMASLAVLVAEADAHLYEAKRSGRGCARGGLLKP